MVHGHELHRSLVHVLLLHLTGAPHPRPSLRLGLHHEYPDHADGNGACRQLVDVPCQIVGTLLPTVIREHALLLAHVPQLLLPLRLLLLQRIRLPAEVEHGDKGRRHESLVAATYGAREKWKYPKEDPLDIIIDSYYAIMSNF